MAQTFLFSTIPLDPLTKGTWPRTGPPLGAAFLGPGRRFAALSPTRRVKGSSLALLGPAGRPLTARVWTATPKTTGPGSEGTTRTPHSKGPGLYSRIQHLRLFHLSSRLNLFYVKRILVETVKPKRFDFIGEPHRLTLGSIWVQPLIYFATPDPGQIIGQVIEINSATPTYTVSLINGLILSNITSADSTAWAIGDWIVVEKYLGTNRIANPGEAPLMDVSDVLRVKSEVRTRAGGKVIIDFDSTYTADPTKASITLSPDAATTLRMYCPPITNVPPAIYEYDLVFYHSNSAPYDPVIRQFGKFEIVEGITRRT
jgi:hypothetical protein